MKSTNILLTIQALFVFLSAVTAQQLPLSAGNTACIPTPRMEEWAINQHATCLSLKSPNARVIFLGDSIAHGMQFGQPPEGGAGVWRERFAPLGAAAFAVPGDKTQNLLWRIGEGGELDGLHPKVVVLLIGVNNLITKNTPDETAAGIAAVVQQVKKVLPDTKILLLGIFPCYVGPDVQLTNAIIANLEDLQQIYYLDIGDKFLESDGKISKTKLRDGLHPSEEGYQVMAEAIQPYLEDLLNNNGQAELWKMRENSKPGN